MTCTAKGPAACLYMQPREEQHMKEAWLSGEWQGSDTMLTAPLATHIGHLAGAQNKSSKRSLDNMISSLKLEGRDARKKFFYLLYFLIFIFYWY